MTLLCGQSSNLYMVSLLDFIYSVSYTDDTIFKMSVLKPSAEY